MIQELKKPVIFEIIDKCENEKYEKVLKKLLYKHPRELYRMWEGNTVYNYALLKRGSCFEKLHNIYLKIQDKLEYKPYHVKSENGYNPLHYAAKNNMINELNYLLNEVGANVDKQDIYGNTPLHLAVISGNIQSFNILMSQSKPTINVLNDDRKSPLYIAIQNKNKHMISQLLKKGAYLKYKVGDVEYNLFDMAKANDLEEFITGVLSKELRRGQIKASPKKSNRALKDMMQKYKELCINLDSKIDYNRLLRFATKLNIKSPKDVPKDELCKKISYRVLFYKTNPDLLSKGESSS